MAATKKYGMMIDVHYCTGCHTCEVACQQENGFSAEEFGIKVHALVTVQDIREYLADKAEYAHLLPLMDAYMKQYCVF